MPDDDAPTRDSEDPVVLRDHPPASVRSLWRLRSYLRPHVLALVVMLVCSLSAVGVAIAIPLVIKALIDGPIEDHRAGAILPLSLLVLALGLLEAFLFWLRRWAQNTAVLSVETAMRHDLYDRLQELPMSFHSRWQSGQLLSRATTDLSAIRRFAGFGLLFLLVNITQVVLTTGVLLHLYWPLGLVVAATSAPIVWLSMRFEKAYVVLSRRVQDQQGDLATLSEEGAVGIRVIKSFGRSRHVSDQYDAAAGRLLQASVDKVRLSAKFWTFLEMIPNLAVVVVLLLGAIGVGRGALTPGDLVAFITLMLSLVWPVASLGVILAMAQEAMTAAARVLEIYDLAPDIVSGSAATPAPRGHLRFEHVDFTFPGSATAVLRDVNLDLAPGETMALVGATGSGKTALTALVPRLYDVTGGRVLIDGVDVRDYSLRDLRSVVATAFEEPTLFSMSARENLTLGRADATDAEIDEAIEIAQAGFVHDLPWGLDTRIGEQGMSLSGGQRQRLALARAVLAQPRVLVLDDTLSALDVHTEKLVEEALARVLGATTGLIVAHRASTVLLADRVALLQDGTISHVGEHRHLLATVPAYRELLAADSDDAGDPYDSGEAPELEDASGMSTDTQAWRGVAADGVDDLDAATTAKLAGRSRRLLRDLLRPYHRVLRLLMIAVVIENAARLSIPLLVARGIDHGIPPIRDHNDLRPLIEIVLMVLGATLLQAVARNIFLVRSGRIGQDILFEIRQRIFWQFQRLSPAFHDSYTSGRVISRQTSDVDALYEMLETGFDGLITAALTLVGTAGLLLYLDLKLGVVALLCGPFLAWATNWFRKESAKSYRVTREKVALVIVHFVESMNGIRAVQAFRREPRNQEIFDDVNDQYRLANLGAFRLVTWFMPEIRLIGNVTIAVVLLYGSYLAYQGHVTVGVLAAFLLYLRQFFEPMMDISQFYNTFQSANAALEKLSGVLEEVPGVPEPTDPVLLPEPRGDLRFDHVEFSYVESVRVLPDLDVAIPSGQTVALVGTTGAGKTTIAKLATRFYDPVAGRVTMDGVDLRSIGSVDLHRAVVMVTQENYLFSGTIADNIRFGRPDATLEEVEAATRAIGAHGFISQLPEGYETEVSNRGGLLSAGQRQLVAFSRAFLADPAVLILDEATSSLDVPSERLVQRALRTILSGRTAVIIAHRLSTVEIADRVLVLEHGRIVEDGTPDDLVAGGSGRFSDLHEAWVASLA